MTDAEILAAIDAERLKQADLRAQIAAKVQAPRPNEDPPVPAALRTALLMQRLFEAEAETARLARENV